MTINEFVEITANLEEFYAKELSATERDIWYEELKHISKKDYISICKECYRNNVFMPKLADLLKYKKSKDASFKSTFQQILDIDENYFYANMRDQVSKENMAKINKILGNKDISEVIQEQTQEVDYETD
jgi:hypothetical protein